MKRRVLLIAYEIPPCGGSIQRVTKFIKYLPAVEWEPLVISTRVENYGLTDNSLVEEIKEAAVSRVGWVRLGARLRNIATRSAGDSSGGELLRQTPWLRMYRNMQAWNQMPDAAVGWILPAAWWGIRLVQAAHADVIYSLSSPYSAHLAGLIVSAKTRRPWVADFRDQWMEDSDRPFPTKLHRRLHARLEALVVRRADKVVTTTRRMAAHLRRSYSDLSRERIHTIMNGYDSADIPSGVAVNGDGFLAVHAGTFYAERSPEGLFRGVMALRARGHPVSREFRIDLYGSKDLRTLELIDRLGLGSVVSHRGYIPHGEVLRRLAAANLLLLVVHDSEMGRLAIPAKIFEYLALRRPVLALAPANSEAAELIRESGRGLVVEPNDAEGIAAAIERVYEESVRGVVRGNNGFIQRFERLELTRELAAVFDEVTRGSSIHPSLSARRS